MYVGGHTTFWSNDFTPVHDVHTRFHEPGMSHLGFGLPFALALKLLHPDKAFINITGDGSFGFTLQELDTARRSGLPAVLDCRTRFVPHPASPMFGSMNGYGFDALTRSEKQ